MVGGWARRTGQCGQARSLDPDGLQNPPLVVVKVAGEHHVAGLLSELAEEVREVRLEGGGWCHEGPGSAVRSNENHEGRRALGRSDKSQRLRQGCLLLGSSLASTQRLRSTGENSSPRTPVILQPS